MIKKKVFFDRWETSDPLGRQFSMNSRHITAEDDYLLWLKSNEGINIISTIHRGKTISILYEDSHPPQKHPQRSSGNGGFLRLLDKND